MESKHKTGFLRRLNVRHSSDVSFIADQVNNAALAFDFDKKERAELILVCRELCTNILAHAGEGQFTLASIEDTQKTGIEFIAEDKGPGIFDINEAMRDGFSSKGSLGLGLGTVNRLMHEMHIACDSGTKIHVKRWKIETKINGAQKKYEISCRSRPYPGLKVCGDACFSKSWDKYILIGVIDGLGHGKEAKQAADKAVTYLGNHYFLHLNSLFEGINRNCQGSRGVVMSLCRLDCVSGLFEIGTVGNIDIRIYAGRYSQKVPLRRGIMGYKSPKPARYSNQFTSGTIVAMCSDGISTRWDWKELPDFQNIDAKNICHYLITSKAREHDDASVAVLKGVV